MSREIEFYFDFGSPNSYLAWTQLHGLAERCDASLRYRPISLGALFKATGNVSPMAVPIKGKYLIRDLLRCAAGLEVPLLVNPHFPLNTLPLMRMAQGIQLRQADDFLPFVTAMFTSIWVDGQNTADPEVLQPVLQQAGLDAVAIVALAQDSDIKAELKRQTDDAVARGVFGAPTFFVGEEMFWGHDRLNHVEDALRASADVQ